MLYHYIKNGLIYDPVEENELIALIRPETLVWAEGMNDWQAAKDIPNLSKLLGKQIQSPPPLPLPSKYAFEVDCNVIQKDKGLPVVAQIILVIVVLLLGAWIFTDFKRKAAEVKAAQNNAQTEQSATQNTQTQAQTKESPQDNELKHPAKYLSLRFKSHKNLLSDRIIEGDIDNNASAASYKDISLQIKFMADSTTVLETKTITLDQTISNGTKLHFKKKFNTYPGKTKMVDVVINGAKGVVE